MTVIPLLRCLASRARTLRALEDVLSTLRASSASAERHHLLISLKRACKAGQSGAFQCTLGAYQQTVRSQHKILAEQVKQQVYGGSKRSLSQLVRRFEAAGTDVASLRRSSICIGDAKGHSEDLLGCSRPRKRPRTSAYEVFRTQHRWSTQEAGKQWAALVPERKAYYEQLAAEQEEEKNKLCSKNLGSIQPDSQDSNAASHLTPRQRGRLGKYRLCASLDMVTQHSAWKRGLRLGCSESPLRADLVNATIADKDVRRSLERRFCFDPRILKNSAVSPNTPCHIKNGGVCCECHRFEQIMNGSVNLFNELKALNKLAAGVALKITGGEEQTPIYLLGVHCKRPPLCTMVETRWRAFLVTM